MALNNFDASIVGRSAKCDSHNVIKKASYNYREKLTDERTGETWDYSKKEDLEWKGLFVPDNAPDWMRDRQTLYMGIERKEDESDNAHNAQLAHSWILALPHELNAEQRKWLMTDFAREISRTGRVVDVAIHSPDKDGDERNYHAHVMVTMREITPDGFGKKIRAPGSNRDDKENNFQKWAKEELAKWKDRYSELGMKHLDRAGFYKEAERFRVGHLKTKEQLKDAERRKDWEQVAFLKDRRPTRHLGPEASAMEREGIKTRKGDKNREIEQQNQERLNRHQNQIVKEIRAAYRQSADPAEFIKALSENEMLLARTSKQDAVNSAVEFAQEKKKRYVPQYREGEVIVVTKEGWGYKLTEQSTGDKPWEIKEFLQPIQKVNLRSLEEAHEFIEQQKVERYKHGPEHAKPPQEPMRQEIEHIFYAFNNAKTPDAFVKDIEQRGLHVARVTERDAEDSKTRNELARKEEKRYHPILREGEYVILNDRGRAFRLDERTTGRTRDEARVFLKPLAGRQFADFHTKWNELHEKRQAEKDFQADRARGIAQGGKGGTKRDHGSRQGS